jgi:hypothetical protein
MPKWDVARIPDLQLFLEPVKANHLISLAVRRSGDPPGFSLLDPGEVPEGSGEPPGGGRRETSSNHAGIGKVEKIVEMRDLTALNLDDDPLDAPFEADAWTGQSDCD